MELNIPKEYRTLHFKKKLRFWGRVQKKNKNRLIHYRVLAFSRNASKIFCNRIGSRHYRLNHTGTI